MRAITNPILVLVCCLMQILYLNGQNDSLYQKSLVKINESIKIASDLNKLDLVAKGYYDRALLNFRIHLRNQDVISDLIESAKIYKYLNDTKAYYNARVALANFYIEEEIFLDDALKLTEEAITYYKNNEFLFELTNGITQMGRAHQKKLNYDRAIEFVNKGLIKSISIGSLNLELDNRLLITELFGNLGNVEKAIEQGNYILEFEKSNSLNRVSHKVNLTLGQVLFRDKKFDQSLAYLKESLSYESSQVELNYQAHMLMSEIYTMQDSTALALNHLHLAADIQNDLYQQEKSAMANQLAAKYQNTEKEKEIKALEQANRLKDFLLTQRTRFFLILITIMTLGALAAFNYYRLQKHKLETEKILSEQNEKITGQKIVDLENRLKIKNLKAMVSGQEAERTRIATDLHDSLGGLLSSLKLQYDTLQLDHTDLTDDEDYHKIMNLIDLACKDVRDISRNLTPAALEKIGLSAAINDLVNRYSIKGSLEISLHLGIVESIASEESRLHIYRIVQELLNNAVKHADANEIDIQINTANELLLIMVEDNGKGFDSQLITQGVGLGNLHSRVKLLNGEIEFDSTLSKGTTAMVRIPLPEMETSLN